MERRTASWMKIQPFSIGTSRDDSTQMTAQAVRNSVPYIDVIMLTIE